MSHVGHVKKFFSPLPPLPPLFSRAKESSRKITNEKRWSTVFSFA